MTTEISQSPTSILPTVPAAAIRWPERHLPANSKVFVSNEIVIDAPPEHVWPWLVRAGAWPEWYKNAHHIHFRSISGPDLRDRARFGWTTFGMRIHSKVLEFEPCTRLAWDAQGMGVEAYHAWLLTPLSGGRTHVLTQETQSGWLAGLHERFLPKRMFEQHQQWLEGLSVKAKAGPPTK